MRDNEMTFEEFVAWSQREEAKWNALPEDEKERSRKKMDQGLAERMGSYEASKDNNLDAK